MAESPAYHRTLRTTSAMLRAYGLTDSALTDAVRLLRSTFHGFTTLEATGGFEAPRPVQTSWKHAVEGLHYLLTHWAEATREAQ